MMGVVPVVFLLQSVALDCDPLGCSSLRRARQLRALLCATYVTALTPKRGPAIFGAIPCAKIPVGLLKYEFFQRFLNMNGTPEDTMKNELADMVCVPCKGGTPPLLGEKLKALHDKLGYSWEVVNEHQLEKEFNFKNFKEALTFTNKVGELAEEVNHHPDIYLSWGKVKIVLYTHKIGGLSEADFVFAAKCDRIG